MTVGERPGLPTGPPLPEGDDGPVPDTVAEPGKPSRAARWSAIAVGVILAGLLVVLVLGLGGDDEVTASPLDGKPAPVLSGPTLDGGQFDLARYRGSWVVVNFFATWCPPCVQEHPALVEFSSSHAAAGDRVLVSVVFNDDPVVVERFFDAQGGGDWPVLVDGDGAAAVAWAVTGVPESVLVAPNGTVVGKLKGGVRAGDLDRIIDDIEQRAEGS